jgi:hypothetical protein
VNAHVSTRARLCLLTFTFAALVVGCGKKTTKGSVPHLYPEELVRAAIIRWEILSQFQVTEEAKLLIMDQFAKEEGTVGDAIFTRHMRQTEGSEYRAVLVGFYLSKVAARPTKGPPKFRPSSLAFTPPLPIITASDVLQYPVKEFFDFLQAVEGLFWNVLNGDQPVGYLKVTTEAQNIQVSGNWLDILTPAEIGLPVGDYTLLLRREKGSRTLTCKGTVSILKGRTTLFSCTLVSESSS